MCSEHNAHAHHIINLLLLPPSIDNIIIVEIYKRQIDFMYVAQHLAFIRK